MKKKSAPEQKILSNRVIRGAAMRLGQGRDGDDVTVRAQELVGALNLASTEPIQKEQGITKSGKVVKIVVTSVLIAIFVVGSAFAGWVIVKSRQNHQVNNNADDGSSMTNDNGGKPGTTNPEANIDKGDDKNNNQQITPDPDNGEQKDPEITPDPIDTPEIFSAVPTIDAVINPSEILLMNEEGDELVVNTETNEIVRVNGFTIKDGEVQVSETMAGVAGNDEEKAEISKLAADAQELYNEIIDAQKKAAADQNGASNGGSDSAYVDEPGLN